MAIADLSRRPTPIDLADFWFYDPDGVSEWASDYYRSNYHTGHLPRPGVGMRGQHWTVRHDWHVWLRGVAWAQGEIEMQKDLMSGLNELGGL